MKTTNEKSLLEKEIKYIREKKVDSKYIDFFEERVELYLKENPEDEDMWLKYALFEAEMPLKDTQKAVNILRKLINYNPNNIKAMLIMADLMNLELGGVDNELLEKLINAKSSNKEEAAMLALTISLFYSKKADEVNEEKWLKKSILLDQKLSCSFTRLGELYFRQGNKKRGRQYIKIGLDNILLQPHDHLDEIDEYINEFVKGINSTSEYIEYMKEEYGIEN